MSYADEVFLRNCRDILDHGVWDTDLPVRPRWEDGTPAHTVKLFGVVNRYDLRREFPMLTVRRQYFKSAVDELLWIWQKKSNNIKDLGSHVWDAWADETGSIGKAYGYQLGVEYDFPEGRMDQVDWILKTLRENPASRRMVTSIFNHHDLKEMGLQPCAWSMTFNVSGRTLNGILNQRSQDMLTANGWNVMQYAALLMMLAQASGLEAGELVHVIADCPWWRSFCGGSPTPPPGSRWIPPSRIFTPLPSRASPWRDTNITSWQRPSRWRCRRPSCKRFPGVIYYLSIFEKRGVFPCRNISILNSPSPLASSGRNL